MKLGFLNCLYVGPQLLERVPNQSCSLEGSGETDSGVYSREHVAKGVRVTHAIV